MTAPPNGLLLLDKPLGLSSNAALQRVRRLAGGGKAGHGGSLDPLASGMLPICLGECTRLAGELLAGRKSYRFELLLGERTDTGDAEGEVIERAPVPALQAAAVQSVLERFHGEQQQIPPMYSALKREGQPLYRLARQGVSVERAARRIRIEALTLLELSAERLMLRVLCSKGTYVRVLGEDLARALGTCGRLASLRREFVEPFAADSMVTLEELCERPPGSWPLLPPDRAVTHLPALTLSVAAAEAITRGRVLELRRACETAGDGATAPQALWRLYDPAGCFLGLGQTDPGGLLRSRRLFPQPVPPRSMT